MVQMQPKKRKHFPRGLSELDSTKAFGTLVKDVGPKDSGSTKHLTMHEQVYTPKLLFISRQIFCH